MGTLRSRNGSALLVAVLAMLALVAASVGAMVALVAAHAQRVAHQRQGLQALYLAEMGLEEMLTATAERGCPGRLQRTVFPPDETPASSPDSTAGKPLLAAETRSPLGSYQVTAETTGGVLAVRALGVVTGPSGRSVAREVRATCRRAGEGWRVERWEQVP